MKRTGGEREKRDAASSDLINREREKQQKRNDLLERKRKRRPKGRPTSPRRGLRNTETIIEGIKKGKPCSIMLRE